MSSLGSLKAKIIPKWRTPGNTCHVCDFCGGGGGLVVGGGTLVVGGGRFCGDFGGCLHWWCISEENPPKLSKKLKNSKIFNNPIFFLQKSNIFINIHFQQQKKIKKKSSFFSLNIGTTQFDQSFPVQPNPKKKIWKNLKKIPFSKKSENFEEEKIFEEKKMPSYSFSNIRRTLQSSPFQNTRGGVPWAWQRRRTDKRANGNPSL